MINVYSIYSKNIFSLIRIIVLFLYICVCEDSQMSSKQSSQCVSKNTQFSKFPLLDIRTVKETEPVSKDSGWC